MKKAIPILLVLALLFCLCACNGDDNRPYEPDTPAPDPHEGLFRSDHGSLRFSGDGKTVTLDFDEYLAGLTGLPAGETEASYVFLSGNLPPHGSVDVRYDVAHELKLTVGDKSVVLQIGEASPDGKGYTAGVGSVTSERIPIVIVGNSERIFVSFEKQAEKK